jgi:hypothetical protein
MLCLRPCCSAKSSFFWQRKILFSYEDEALNTWNIGEQEVMIVENPHQPHEVGVAPMSATGYYNGWPLARRNV